MKNVILAAVGLIGLATGCCYQKADHWAGVCDCNPKTYACRTGPTGSDAMIVTTGSAVQAAPVNEKIIEMPKQMP